MTVFMIKASSTEPNSTFGIKLPITYSHKEVWRRTHQFLSIIIAGFLPAYFLLIFFWFHWGRFWSSVALVIIPLLISSIYAKIIGRPYEKSEAEELKKQIQKEQGYRRLTSKTLITSFSTTLYWANGSNAKYTPTKISVKSL